MTEASLTCVNHPDRHTTLRCNRCEQPICSRCAVLTPVGYRCKACVRGQQAGFDTARPADHALAGAVSAVAVGVSTALLGYLEFWSFFIAPVAGGGIAEAVRWIVRRRRSRRLALVAAVGGSLGVLANLAVHLARVALFIRFDIQALGEVLGSMLWPVVTGVLIVGALYYRLKGIRL
jgi:hypothetical protein